MQSFYKNVLKFAVCVAVIGVLGTSNLAAQKISEIRPYDEMVLDASSFPALSGDSVAVGDLCMMAYDAMSDAWRVVPFQIDQKDTSGSFFGEFDNFLDDNDQLVFVSRDFGDQAPFNAWVDDAEARSHERYEFEFVDTLNPGATGYLYLYRSSTIDKSGMTSYMRYAPAPTGEAVVADTVAGFSYVQGHENFGGLPNYVSSKSTNGVSALQDVNFVDRLKIRVNASVRLGLITIPLNLKEDSFEGIALQVKSGPVRVLRETENQVTLLGSPVFSTKILVKFYPFSSILSANLDLPTDINFKLLRVSVDLNNAATGATFYNHANGATTIDGAFDDVDRSILLSPELNWDVSSGSFGAYVKIVELDVSQLVNSQARYYYHDDASGTDDGTDDTGDLMSFADAGVLVTGDQMSGLFPVFIKNYIFPPDVSTQFAFSSIAAADDSAKGPLLAAQVSNPIGQILRLQGFDATAPGAITDLGVLNMTETNISLGWTASGDDGDGNGAATSYTLYYSTTPVGDDIPAWISTAQTATDLPAPGAPGASETYTVEGLNAQDTYYFVLTTTDDFGNVSDFSNVASGVAVPVELAAFQAQVSNNEVNLTWQTASETNNAGFAVERKLDANGAEWIEVGFIDGRGTTAQAQAYQFSDVVNEPGVYLYRLRQIDFDGAFEYSGELRVSVAVPTELQLAQNYPNPFKQGTGSTIRYSLPDRRNLSVALRIVNVLGQQIGALVNEEQQAGYYQITWNGRLENGSRVPPGIYFLVLETIDARTVRKLSILP